MTESADPYVTFSSATNQVTVSAPTELTSSISSVANYYFDITLGGVLLDQSTLTVIYTLEPLTAQDQEPPTVQEHEPPQFLLLSDTMYGAQVIAGEAWNYTLPEVYHPQDKQISKIEARLGSAYSFITFDDQEGVLKIAANKTTNLNEGLYLCSFIAVDVDLQMSDKLLFMLTILPSEDE